MNAFRWSVGLAFTVILHLMGTSAAQAQGVSPAAPVAPEQATPQPIPVRSSDSQPDRLNSEPLSQTVPSQEAVPSCPAGQFASAFPDVPPDHWAFEAVNRLAATPVRCFPVSPQS